MIIESKIKGYSTKMLNYIPDAYLKYKNIFKKLYKMFHLIYVTKPIGYRAALDDKILDNSFGFSSISFLKRVSWSSRWVEVSGKEARNIRFDIPPPKENGLFVGVYHKC